MTARRVAGFALGAILWSVMQAGAAEFPDWAYPSNPPLGPFDATTPKRMPGSAREFTQAQIEDSFNPPDWFPEDHPAMPPVVANGRPPDVKACAKCHISNGAGHPESSDLAGLPRGYIARQMADFKSGARHGGRAGSMLAIAKAISDEELRAAADYYAALAPVEWTRVVETRTVPQTRLGTGGMRFAVEDGPAEPIGDRIIELPQAPERAEMRDSRMGFIALVPVGSIAKGRTLVATGDGRTLPCATCHGADFKGTGEVPRIGGRSPIYVFRQLNDVKAGTRSGPTTQPMQQVVADLGQDDMLSIAAYLATLTP